MGTFLSFHVKTNDRENLIRILQERSNLIFEQSNEFPGNILDNPIYDMDCTPDFLAVNQPLSGWASILHNGFAKLHEWGIFISAILGTSFIQIIAQENSDYYYFLYYSKGKLLRELEVDSMQLEIITDSGEKFSFEKNPVITEYFEDENNFFNTDTLESYCKEFGLDIPALYTGSNFILLKKQS